MAVQKKKMKFTFILISIYVGNKNIFASSAAEPHAWDAWFQIRLYVVQASKSIKYPVYSFRQFYDDYINTAQLFYFPCEIFFFFRSWNSLFFHSQSKKFSNTFCGDERFIRCIQMEARLRLIHVYLIYQFTFNFLSFFFLNGMYNFFYDAHETCKNMVILGWITTATSMSGKNK